MAEITLTAPDGKTIVLTPPEGATQAQIDAVIADVTRNYRAASPERSAGESIVRGIAMPAQGFNESLARTIGGLPDMVGAGMRAVGLPSSAPGQYTDWARRGIQAVTGAPRPAENTAERLLEGAGRGVGDVASVLLPAAAVANTARAGSMAQGVASALSAQPAAQLAAGAMGGGVTEATGNPYAGLAAALLTPMVAGGTMRAISAPGGTPNPERAALVAAARREGIPLTSGQATGSRPQQYIEAAFERLPFTAGGETARNEAQHRAFTAASLARSGTVSDVATPDVLRATAQRLGGVFTDVSSRNTLRVTPEVRATLEQMSDDASRFLEPGIGHVVRERIAQVLKHPDGDAIPGAFYRQMDSALGHSARGARDGNLSTAITDLRETLRTAMDASISPADKAAWDLARRQYANFKVSQNAAGRAGEQAALGQIPPVALHAAIQQGTGRNYAMGAGDQNRLARIGQALLRPLPQSGTAGHTMAQRILTGEAAATGGAAFAGADPATSVAALAAALAGPPLARAAYYSGPVQRWLTDGIPALHGAANAMPQVDRALVAAILANQGPAALAGPRQ